MVPLENKTRVLVVDDDIQLLNLLVDTLTSIGFQTTGVPGGLEALDLLLKETFDLVVSDIKMPGLDGIGLLKKIRRRYPRLPVLFITGVPTADVFGPNAPDGFLPKPFRISRIEELIEKTLAASQAKLSQTVKKILVVDHNDANRELLTEGLSAHNVVAIAVADGAEAISQLEQGSVDAVIADIEVAGTNNQTLTSQIKSNYSDIAIVLVADESTRAAMSGADKNHVDGFIDKPITADGIERILDALSVPLSHE